MEEAPTKATLEKKVTMLSDICKKCIPIFKTLRDDDLSDYRNEISITEGKAIISDLATTLNETASDISSTQVPPSALSILNRDIEKLIHYVQDGHTQNASVGIDHIKNILYKHEKIKRFCLRYNAYKSIDFAAKNTVILGANGAGKTSLVMLFKEAVDNIEGTVITAQKVLYIPALDEIPLESKTEEEYRAFQQGLSDLRDEDNFSRNYESRLRRREHLAEFEKVLSRIISKKASQQNDILRRLQKEISKNALSEETRKLVLEQNSLFDQAINIWNRIIVHRTLFYDNEFKLKLSDGTSNYAARYMSDGEKVALYCIARVLLTPNNSIIIVDEPEMHLHKSICNKLWDELEKAKADCTFIYITHDVDFASSRNAKKYWVKNFTKPATWDVEEISQERIPEEILLKLLGSRRPILFCEGNENSFDKKIFEVLFPKFTIECVNSCQKVITYTKTFKEVALLKGKLQAVGLIDRDYKTEEQLIAFKADNIYSYNVAEVDNIFLLEKLVTMIAQRFFCRDFCFDDCKEAIIKEMQTHKDEQVLRFASYYIQHQLRNYTIHGCSSEELQTDLKSFTSSIDVIATFNERNQALDKMINEKDYESIIKVFNEKGLKFKIGKILGIKDYPERAISYLQQATPDDIKFLYDLFPPELVAYHNSLT